MANSINTPTQSPSIILDANEARFILAYRKMDDRRRSEALHFAEVQAINHPRRVAPVLRLIAGGAV